MKGFVVCVVFIFTAVSAAVAFKVITAPVIVVGGFEEDVDDWEMLKDDVVNGDDVVGGVKVLEDVDVYPTPLA